MWKKIERFDASIFKSLLYSLMEKLMIYYIFAGICALAAIVFWVIRSSSLHKLEQILGTETSTIKQIEDRHYHNKSSSSGEFKEHVEIKGSVVCEEPIIAKLCKEKCIYCSTTITHVYEERYRDTDSNGNTRWRTRKRNDIVSEDVQHVPFYVQDDTGKIKINSNEAKIDAIEVVNKLEQKVEEKVSYGNVAIEIASAVFNTSSSKTIGYRMVESIVPIDKKLYILGEASNASGELSIQESSDSKKSFIISTKSEAQLIKKQTSALKWLTIGFATFLIGAITLAILGYKFSA